MGRGNILTMIFKKRAFTLVELMVAVLLSAIIVFFSYTMTISAYKMFTKMHNTSYNIDNVKFFEEAFKKSVFEADEINIDKTTATDVDELRFRRYDVNLGEEVIDVYTLDDENGTKLKFNFDNSTNYEVYPEQVDDTTLGKIKPVKLFVETRRAASAAKISKMLLLNNVKAFYCKVDKTTGATSTTTNLRDITIGIIYYDDSVKKRQNRSFCFTARGIIA